MPGALVATTDGPIASSPIPPPIPIAALPVRRRRSAVLAPGSRIGAWRIERELGRGGMATVYAAVHTRFGKRAALKLAHPAILGSKFTPETFLREARIANLVDHPGVTEVFATGSYGGRPYLAMERLRGRSLGARLGDGELPHDLALDILIELCDVLGAAHAAGVIHGDLKVDNVFLLDEPGAGGRRTKLLDWGIARIAGEDDPLDGLITGTLTYVAPEHICGECISPASDIYALGVLAYRLLLGEPPFSATSDLVLLQKHLRDAPPRPSAWWPDIPAALESTLLAMLAKQRASRPALREIAAALRAARLRIRPSRLSWIRRAVTPPTGARIGVPGVPGDVIGRPVLAVLPGRTQRVAGAALGVALVVASVLQLFIA